MLLLFCTRTFIHISNENPGKVCRGREGRMMEAAVVDVDAVTLLLELVAPLLPVPVLFTKNDIELCRGFENVRFLSRVSLYEAHLPSMNCKREWLKDSMKPLLVRRSSVLTEVIRASYLETENVLETMLSIHA